MQNWWQTSWGPKANKGCLPTTEPEDAPVEGACCQPKYVWCVNQDAAPSVAVGSSPQSSVALYVLCLRCRKSFDKAHHSLTVKMLQKVVKEGTFPNIIKAINDKPTANLILSETLKAFPLRSGMGQGRPSHRAYSTVSSHSLFWGLHVRCCFVDPLCICRWRY